MRTEELFAAIDAETLESLKGGIFRSSAEIASDCSISVCEAARSLERLKKSGRVYEYGVKLSNDFAFPDTLFCRNLDKVVSRHIAEHPDLFSGYDGAKVFVFLRELVSKDYILEECSEPCRSSIFMEVFHREMIEQRFPNFGNVLRLYVEHR